jgi:hypothetical protein
MAYEFDSQEARQRLIESYRSMSDDELLELAAKPDDLTDFAGEILRSELRSRRLQPARLVVAAAPTPVSIGWKSSGGETKYGKVSPITFYDAIKAGQACEYLDEMGVAFELKDLWEPEVGIPALKGPPAELQLLVDKSDLDITKAILREKMGLFPLQEVAVADEPVDDGTVTTLGDFGRRADAEEVARVLEDAHLWHRIVTNPDGTVENEDCFTLEVKEIDVVRAGELVERVLNLPEE